MRHIVRPAGLDLETPGRRDYHVAMEHDSIWGDHLIPLTVLVGPDAQAGTAGWSRSAPTTATNTRGRSRSAT